MISSLSKLSVVGVSILATQVEGWKERPKPEADELSAIELIETMDIEQPSSYYGSWNIFGWFFEAATACPEGAPCATSDSTASQDLFLNDSNDEVEVDAEHED